MKIKSFSYFIFFLLTTYSTVSSAQLLNVESQRIQKDSVRFVLIADVTYNSQKNNNESLSVFNTAITTQFKSKSMKDLYIFLGSYDYAVANGENISNAGFFHFRYNHRTTKSLKLEAFIQTQYNEVLDLKTRTLLGIGSRFKIFGKEAIEIYFGSLYMYEYEKTADSAITEYSFNRLSSYLSLAIKLPKKVGELVSVTYYQPRLDLFANYRISSQTGLNFNLTSKIIFSNSFNVMFDSNPPSGINSINLNYTNGIKFVF